MQRNEEAKVFMDKEGYERLLLDIECLKEELKKINRGRGIIHKAGEGDSWDSTEFSNLEMSVRVLANEIRRRQLFLDKVVILEKQNLENCVDFDDILRLNFIYSEDDTEELIIKLVGTALCDSNNSYEEVSINSPVGMAIYGKQIGERVSYQVETRTFNVEILEKLNMNQNKNASHVKTLKK